MAGIVWSSATMGAYLQSAVLLILAAGFSGCAQHKAPADIPTRTPLSVSTIAAGFTNYLRVTKSAVYVNPELAMLCRGASQEEVDAARVQFGPHANAAIVIYMNNLAVDAFATDASSFPAGSVVVKQKYVFGHRSHEGTLVRQADAGVGGMVKRSPGYDPAHGDWEYFYFEDPKKIESGRITSCVTCHSSARQNDHVFGTWRTKGG